MGRSRPEPVMPVAEAEVCGEAVDGPARPLRDWPGYERGMEPSGIEAGSTS
jgi:hypothetical protein